jgi:hypothetical protein
LGPEVVGLLPMGGNGIRLGLPFPKPLAPTITDDGIVPLYVHSLRRLREVTPTVYGAVNESTCRCLHRSMDSHNVRALLVEEQPSLPKALAQAAKFILGEAGRDVWIAVALPDSLWDLRDGASLRDVVKNVRGDGALALFIAGADELDDVVVADDKVVAVTTKQPGDTGMVRGWGAFVIRAKALLAFNDKEKDGPQLGKLDMGWAFLGHSIDLGTPDRYVRWHDMRSQNARPGEGLLVPG